MVEFESLGLNFWEVLVLAILLIWAVNRFFRKRNEADDEAIEPYDGRAPDRFAPYQPMDQGWEEEFDRIDKFNRGQLDRIIDDLSARQTKYTFTGR